jgi:tetratricopeptide (TPR) repeat protein
MKRAGKIVPVMLETCEPEDLHLGLLPIQYIDFRDNREQALERLLAVWRRDKASQIKSLYDAAKDFAAKEDWASAIEKLEAVLRLDSTQTKALAELEHVRRQEYLVSTYKDGVTAVREKRWRDAFATLRQLREVDSGYKDVEKLVALAGGELAKEEADQLFRQGLETAERHDWTKAVELFEAVLKISPSHELAHSELRRALQQKEAAEFYAEGRAHMEARRWSDALMKFRRVRSIARGYKDVSEQIADADAALAEEEERHRTKPTIVRRKKDAAELQQQQPVQKAAAVQVPPSSQEKTPKKIYTAPPPARILAFPKRSTLLKFVAISAMILFSGLVIWFSYGDIQAYRHNSQGDELFNQQKYAEAEVLYRTAVEANPSDADYRNNLAGALFQQSKFAEAELQLRKAVELSPDTALHHDRLGEVLRWQKKFTDAEVECRKAVELDANYASYHYTLANVLDDQSRYPEAEAEYEKAVELDPNEIIYHKNFSMNLWNQKKYAAAEAEYRKVLQLDPNDSWYHDNLGNSLYCSKDIKTLKLNIERQ